MLIDAGHISYTSARNLLIWSLSILLISAFLDDLLPPKMLWWYRRFSDPMLHIFLDLPFHSLLLHLWLFELYLMLTGSVCFDIQRIFCFNLSFLCVSVSILFEGSSMPPILIFLFKFVPKCLFFYLRELVDRMGSFADMYSYVSFCNFLMQNGFVSLLTLIFGF